MQFLAYPTSYQIMCFEFSCEILLCQQQSHIIIILASKLKFQCTQLIHQVGTVPLEYRSNSNAQHYQANKRTVKGFWPIFRTVIL